MTWLVHQPRNALFKQTNKLSCCGLAAATERVTALSSAPAAEFMGSCHSAPFKSILSPSSSDTIKKKKRSERLSIWVGLGRSAERLWEGPYCIPGGGAQKECCTNSPSGQTDVQNRFFTADETAIFCHATVSWGAIKFIYFFKLQFGVKR